MPVPRPRPGQGKYWLLSTVAILAMTAVAVWFGLASSLTKPTWQTLTYLPRGDSAIVVKYQVRRPEGMSVRCLLQAKSMRHAIVGSAQLTLPAELGRDVTGSYTIRTTSTAVTAEVRSCREM